MAIFGIFHKKEPEKGARALPYLLVTEWEPYRLYSDRKSSTNLHIRLKNTSGDPLLSSIVVKLPSQLGFDEIALAREKEIKIGELAPNEEKEFYLPVYKSASADRGEYTVTLTAIAHYRTYDHVINAIRKQSTIEIV